MADRCTCAPYPGMIQADGLPRTGPAAEGRAHAASCDCVCHDSFKQFMGSRELATLRERPV